MTQEEKAEFVRLQMNRAKTDPDFAAERWIQEQQGGFATWAEKDLAQKEAARCAHEMLHAHDKMSQTKNEIQAHIENVRLNLAAFCEELQKRAADHDDSKLSDAELPIYQAVDATPREAFGTPAYYERLGRLKPALDHHYAKNDHHPEHYQNGVAGMNLAALVEMFCDWKASSQDMAKSVNHCCDRFGIPPMLRQILLNSI